MFEQKWSAISELSCSYLLCSIPRILHLNWSHVTYWLLRPLTWCGFTFLRNCISSPRTGISKMTKWSALSWHNFRYRPWPSASLRCTIGINEYSRPGQARPGWSFYKSIWFQVSGSSRGLIVISFLTSDIPGRRPLMFVKGESGEGRVERTGLIAAVLLLDMGVTWWR